MLGCPVAELSVALPCEDLSVLRELIAIEFLGPKRPATLRDEILTQLCQRETFARVRGENDLELPARETSLLLTVVEVLTNQEHAATIGQPDEVLAPFVLDLVDGNRLAGAHDPHHGDVRFQVGAIQACPRRFPWPEPGFDERDTAYDRPDHDVRGPRQISLRHHDHCHERRDNGDEQPPTDPAKWMGRQSAQQGREARTFLFGEWTSGLLQHVVSRAFARRRVRLPGYRMVRFRHTEMYHSAERCVEGRRVGNFAVRIGSHATRDSRPEPPRMGRIIPASMLNVIVVTIGFAPMTSLCAQDTIISREAFLAREWRLTGMIFPMLPPGGYPITFRHDGSLLSRNLQSATTWALSNGVLRLSGSNGEDYYRFQWVADAGLFRQCPGAAVPPLIIFPVGSGASTLGIRCPDSTPLHPPRREAAVTCRLRVVPDSVRHGEPIEFRYEITSADSQRVSGRYFRLDEEAFGHSLRLRDASGADYRFLRTAEASYLMHFAADDGDVTPRTYRFVFPTPRGEYARLVPADIWRRVWTLGDTANARLRAARFSTGATAVPPGDYEIDAELPRDIFRTRDRIGDRDRPIIGGPGIAPVRCEPARLSVTP